MEKKAIIDIGDLHINGDSIRMRAIRNVTDQICNEIKEKYQKENVVIIQTGDFFDATQLTGPIVDFANSIVDSYLEVSSNVHIITGNHDKKSDTGNALHSLAKRKGLSIHEKDINLRLLDRNIRLMPHVLVNERPGQSIEEYYAEKLIKEPIMCEYAFGHFSDTRMSVNLDQTKGKFRVFLGHEHDYTNLDTDVYIGSVIPVAKNQSHDPIYLEIELGETVAEDIVKRNPLKQTIIFREEEYSDKILKEIEELSKGYEQVYWTLSKVPSSIKNQLKEKYPNIRRVFTIEQSKGAVFSDMDLQENLDLNEIIKESIEEYVAQTVDEDIKTELISVLKDKIL